MRYLVVLCVLAGALVLAPAAGAKDYRFLASDGTRCVLSTSHAGMPEAGGTWTVDIEANVSCDRPLLHAFVWTGLDDDPESDGYIDSTGESCNNDWFFDVGTCDTFPVGGRLTKTGLPAGEYTHGASVFMILHDGPPPVWVLTPIRDQRQENVQWGVQCRPGFADVSCDFHETFTLG